MKKGMHNRSKTCDYISTVFLGGRILFLKVLIRLIKSKDPGVRNNPRRKSRPAHFF